MSILMALLGVFSSAIFSGTSLLYATLGEVVTERSGTVNLGLEGVLLVSAATGYGVTVMTGNPFLGVLAAMLTGGLVNMVFAYLIVTRRANQLASGLALLFFGYGLSALIGKPFIGKMITSLPRYMIPGVGKSSPSLYISFQIRSTYLPGHPSNHTYLVDTLPHPLGIGIESGGRKSRNSLCFWQKSGSDQISGIICWWAFGGYWCCPSFYCVHDELGRIYDRRQRIHCHCIGDLFQMASDPCHCRGPGF